MPARREIPLPAYHTFTFAGPWREVACGGQIHLIYSIGVQPFIICNLCGQGARMEFVGKPHWNRLRQGE